MVKNGRLGPLEKLWLDAFRNNNTIEFIVPPPAAEADANEPIEIWIPLGAAPVELRLCLISLQAAPLQAGDSRLDTREAQVALMVLHAALPNSSANTSTCTARPLPRMALASVEISVGGLATYIRMIGI